MSTNTTGDAHWPDVSVSANKTKLVPRGLEPRTLRLLAVRSNQLSYETTRLPIRGFSQNKNPKGKRRAEYHSPDQIRARRQQ